MSPTGYPAHPSSPRSGHGTRSAYVADSVSTASPARLVTMLYDRLLLDLDRAGAALDGRDFEASGTALVHAQDIVLELKAGLRADTWSGGPALDALYTFLHRELVAANVAADPAKVASCRGLVQPLAEAWHDAERQVLAAAGVADAGAAGTAGRGGIAERSLAVPSRAVS